MNLYSMCKEMVFAVSNLNKRRKTAIFHAKAGVTWVTNHPPPTIRIPWSAVASASEIASSISSISRQMSSRSSKTFSSILGCSLR